MFTHKSIHSHKIERLRKALEFLCMCVSSIKDHKEHLHTSVHEWIIGPLVE